MLGVSFIILELIYNLQNYESVHSYILRPIALVGLYRFGLSPHDISYVICTKAQGDKVGNLNLFVNAVQIVAGEVGKGDNYQYHGFHEVEQHEIA